MPAGGATGQVLTKSSATDYATVWAAAAGGANVHVGPSAPPTPATGDLWWRNDPDGVLFVFYTDADSSQWVPATPTQKGDPGPGYTATSATSLTVGVGNMSLTTQAGLAYTSGARVRIGQATQNIWLEGLVTSYNATSGAMGVAVDLTNGSGTFNAWNLNLAGVEGLTGPAGPQGVAGPTGPTGSTGPQGPTGSTGAQGPAGPPGITWRGAWSSTTSYAANDAVTYGGSSYGATVAIPANTTPPVTDARWALLASAGAPGATGPTGPAGATGPQGAPGATGATGPAGADSTVPGPQGPQGATGATGAQGPQGNPGATGAQGPAGSTGPQGPPGITWQGTWSSTTSYAVNDGVTYAGSSYRATVAIPANAQTPVVDSRWGLVASAGTPGATGATGPQGPTGATGSQGPQGIQGNTGATGPQGATGPAGPATYASIGTTAPATPAVGQLWWRSDTGRLMIWYDDGNSQQWVPAVPV